MNNQPDNDFMSLCLAGTVLPDDIHDFIDLWHTGRCGQDQELHNYLGMTWAEYARWLNAPSSLDAILRDRETFS